MLGPHSDQGKAEESSYHVPGGANGSVLRGVRASVDSGRSGAVASSEAENVPRLTAVNQNNPIQKLYRTIWSAKMMPISFLSSSSFISGLSRS
jgi:hypothetical protein